MTTTVRQPGNAVRVLLAIDQPVLAKYIALALTHGTYLTHVTDQVEDTLAAFTTWHPHIAIVDIDIAQDSILERLGYTAPSSDRIPLIALTRRSDLKTKLAAFDAGVDDILAIPFSPEELVARLMAVLRRTYHEAMVFTPVLRLGDLEIDMLNRRVVAGGSELHLTAIEQNLLYLLAANAGQLLTRDDILDHLWGAGYTAESNVVDRHIHNLRVKLQNGWRHPRYIATIAGHGYRFVPTVADDPTS